MSWLGRKNRSGDGFPQDGEQQAGETWDAGTTTGARANTAALMRVLVWGLVTSGPVLGLLALQRASAPAGEVQAPEVPVDVVTGDPVGPAGFAELFVAAYLETDSESAGDVLAVYYPGAGAEQLRSASGTPPRAEHLAVVGSEEVAAGYWSVTVAAQVDEDHGQDEVEGEASAGPRLRYFQVPVAADEDGWVAVAYPSEVAAPAVEDDAPELGYTPVTLLDSDPAAATVAQFLASYLTGGGDVSRYLSPEVDLAPVTPAPYTAVQVTGIDVRGEAPRQGEALPMTAGGRVQLLVTAEAQTPGGVLRPLSYALVLAERDGRWEIAALEAVPGLPDDSTNREDGAR